MSLQLDPFAEAVLREAATRENLSIDDLILRTFSIEKSDVEEAALPARRVSALGKYAHVPGASEAFALEKQLEIAREDRPRR